MTTRLPDASQQVAADAVVDRIDGGTGAGSLRILSGTAPADADTAESGDPLVAIPLQNPAYGAADASGTAALQGTPVSASATGTGTAGYFRLADGDGTVVVQGDVRASADPDNGEELVLDNTSISSGQTVSVSSLDYTQPADEA